MSDRLPNLSYYDSTGQAYGFSKPYSEDRARMIDEEVSRIINEQYERAKSILREHAAGHNKLADTLYNREVIFTEDVELIFGKRKWTSRTDEILAAQQAAEKAEEKARLAARSNEDDKAANGQAKEEADVIDVTATEITEHANASSSDTATPPPVPSGLTEEQKGDHADPNKK